MPADLQLDERQSRVFQALDSRNSRLGGMYRHALEALAAPASPGCETARVSVICHCGRELMNVVPSIMSEIDIPRPKPSSESLKSKLPELLKNVNLEAIKT